MLFKKVKLTSQFGTDNETDSLTIDIQINEKGEFFCEIPDKIICFFEKNLPGNLFILNKTCLALKAPRYDSLIKQMQHALDLVTRPTVSQEKVIAFELETFGRFSFNVDGETDAQGSKDFYFYSDHQGSCLGFKLAAHVYYRTTVNLNSELTEKLEPYPSPKIIAGDKAARLNAWRAEPNPKHCKIIPYTDEAAEYFLSLFKGISQTTLHISDDIRKENLDSESTSWDHRYFAKQESDSEK